MFVNEFFDVGVIGVKFEVKREEIGSDFREFGLRNVIIKENIRVDFGKFEIIDREKSGLVGFMDVFIEGSDFVGRSYFNI